MPNYTTNTAAALAPEDVGPLIIQPVAEQSIAGQASTVTTTSSHEHRVPVLVEDPASAWVAEGAEIPADDADLDEVLVTPAKLATLVVLSRELIADSLDGGIDAGSTVQQSLVRSLSDRLDQALPGTPMTSSAGSWP